MFCIYGHLEIEGPVMVEEDYLFDKGVSANPQ